MPSTDMLLRVDITPGMFATELLATFVDASGAVLATLADVRLFACDSEHEYRLVVRASRLDDGRWMVALPGTTFGTALQAVVDDDLIVERLDDERAKMTGASYAEDAEAGRRVLDTSARSARATAWLAYEQSGEETALTAALVASGIKCDEAALRSRAISRMNEMAPPPEPQLAQQAVSEGATEEQR